MYEFRFPCSVPEFAGLMQDFVGAGLPLSPRTVGILSSGAVPTEFVLDFRGPTAKFEFLLSDCCVVSCSAPVVLADMVARLFGADGFMV